MWISPRELLSPAAVLHADVVHIDRGCTQARAICRSKMHSANLGAMHSMLSGAKDDD